MSTNERLLGPVQNATENPRLEFRDGQMLFALTNHEGGRVERLISAEAAREAFTNVPIDSGWLDQRIVRWGNGKAGEWAVAFFASAVYELELTRENAGEANTPYSLNVTVDRVKTPLPGLVWFGIQNQYYIWAVKSPALKPYFEVYRCPLPNVEANGNICWGPFKPPRCTAKTIFEAFDLFIKSTFNNHRANGKSKTHKEDVRLMLRELSDNESRNGDFCYARGDEGAKFCGDHRRRHCEVIAGASFWKSDEGRAHLVKCMKVDHLIHHSFAIYPVDDLIRQVEHTGVTLDQAIRNYFEMGEMPS